MANVSFCCLCSQQLIFLPPTFTPTFISIFSRCPKRLRLLSSVVSPIFLFDVCSRWWTFFPFTVVLLSKENSTAFVNERLNDQMLLMDFYFHWSSDSSTTHRKYCLLFDSFTSVGCDIYVKSLHSTQWSVSVPSVTPLRPWPWGSDGCDPVSLSAAVRGTRPPSSCAVVALSQTLWQ